MKSKADLLIMKNKLVKAMLKWDLDEKDHESANSMVNTLNWAMGLSNQSPIELLMVPANEDPISLESGS